MRNEAINRIIIAGIIAAIMVSFASPAIAQDGPAVVGVGDEVLLELPPPPVSGEPPEISLSMIESLRHLQPLAAVPVPTPQAAAPADMPDALQVALAKDAGVESILSDVGRGSSGRRMLESMLFEQLRAALPGSENYIFEQPTIPDYLKLPESGWSVNYSFRLPQRGVGKATFTGRLVEKQSGAEKRFSGVVTIDRESNGVTVRRVVRRGETIAEMDLEMLPARLSQLPRGTLDAAEQAIGSVARKEIRPGEWLTDQVMTVPSVVKRGQAVTMKLERGPLTISATGIAQQPGGKGQMIKVLNMQSKREIFARILSKDEVQVIY